MRLFSRVSSVSRPRGSVMQRPPVDDFADLMAAVSRGNRDAFAELFDLTSDVIWVYLAPVLPDRGVAAEVLAQTYVEVWWLAGCYRAVDGTVLTWIRQIAGRRVNETKQRMSRFPQAARIAGPTPAVRELAMLLGRPVESVGTVIGDKALGRHR
jgi:hypothetical protein